MLSLRFPARTLACLVLVAVALLAPATATADRAGGSSRAAPQGLPLARLLAGLPPAVPPPADPSRPLLTFPTTENPNAVAVDPRTDHIFLLIPPPGDQVLHGTYPAPGPGTLATYDERSGALVRTIPTASGTGKLLLDGPRNRLYVITGTIQVVDTRTGALLRTIPFFSSATAIDPASGHLLLATTADVAGLPLAAGPDDAVIAVDPLAPRGPAVIFRTRLGTNLDAIGVDPLHGRVYVADAGPYLQPGEQCVPGHCTSAIYTLDSAGGRLLTTIALHNPAGAAYPEHATCLAVAPEAGRVVVTETAGDRSTGEARVLDARTGALISTSGADYDPCVLAMDRRSGLPFIAHAALYDTVPPSSGVEILDALHGTYVTGLQSPGRYPVAAVADPYSRAVYVLWASYSQPPAELPPGVLTVLDGGTGAEVREVPLAANPLAAAPDPRRGGLIALNRPALPGNNQEPVVGTSSLTTIPAALAAPAGTVLLHHGPTGIVVDPRTHRAFVIAAGLPTAPARPATGLVDVVDTTSGALLRSVPVGIAPSSVALDAAAGKVYVLNGGFGDRFPPSISVLSATDGTLLAIAGVGASPQALYALSGNLYLVGQGTVEARDGNTGALLSRRTLPGAVRSVAVDAARGHLWLAVDLASRGVEVFDAAGTAAPRIFSYGSEQLLAVDAAGGHLYLAPSYGRPVIVDLDPSGRPARTITLPVAATWDGEEPLTVALAADSTTGRLFAITSPPAKFGLPLPATLWLVDAATGRVLGSHSLGVAPSGLAIDAASGHIFVPDAGGTVQIFDARSGTPLGTAITEPGARPLSSTSTEPAAATLAIDPASGHVLVVNTAADSLSILDAKSGSPLPLRPAIPPPAPAPGPADAELPALSSATTHAARSADGLVHLRRYPFPIGAIGAHGWRPRAPAFRTIKTGTTFATADLPFAVRIRTSISTPFPEVTLANEAGTVLRVAAAAAAGLSPTNAPYGALASDGSVNFLMSLTAGGSTVPSGHTSFLDLQVWSTVGGVTLGLDALSIDPTSATAILHLVLPRGRQLVPGPDGALLVTRGGSTNGPPDFVLGPAVAGESANGAAWLAPGQSRSPIALSLAAAAGGSEMLTMHVDRTWLARHHLSYVFLPIATGQSVAQSGSVVTLERCPSSQASTSGRLLVGRQGVCAERGLLSFPLPALPDGATLQNVTLHLSSPILAGPTGIAAYAALASSPPAGGLLSIGSGLSPQTATAAVAEQLSTDATGEHRWDLTDAIGPGLRGPAPGTLIVGLQGDDASLGFFTGQELPQTDPADTPYLEITYRPRTL